MQTEIDRLKALLEDEKQNMGAAGKRREDELLNEINSLRKELASRAQRIDELKLECDRLVGTVAQRDQQIGDLLAQLQGLKDIVGRLEEELRQAQQSGDQGVQSLRL